VSWIFVSESSTFGRDLLLIAMGVEVVRARERYDQIMRVKVMEMREAKGRD